MGEALVDIEEVREALRAGTVRVEFSFTFSSSGMLPCAQIFVPGETSRSKWKRVGPLLLPADGGGRKELFELLGHLYGDTEVEEVGN